MILWYSASPHHPLVQAASPSPVISITAFRAAIRGGRSAPIGSWPCSIGPMMQTQYRALGFVGVGWFITQSLSKKAYNEGSSRVEVFIGLALVLGSTASDEMGLNSDPDTPAEASHRRERSLDFRGPTRDSHGTALLRRTDADRSDPLDDGAQDPRQTFYIWRRMRLLEAPL